MIPILFTAAHEGVAAVSWPVVPRVGEEVRLQERIGNPLRLRWYVTHVAYDQVLRPLPFGLVHYEPVSGEVAVTVELSRHPLPSLGVPHART